jgi:hypothetical protein
MAKFATYVRLLLAGGAFALSSPCISQSASPQPFHLEQHANVIALMGDWSSSGAVTDSGIIADVLEHAPRSEMSRGVTLYVVETLSGSQGSFTWEFTRHFAPVAGPSVSNGIVETGGAWQMLDGTGAFAGITGEGTFRGTLNTATGALDDVFDGHVRIPQ